VFGQKREEVRGGHRILHNEEVHDLCISPEGRVARGGDKIYRLLVGKPDGKRPWKTSA
jgi:hypothetical protein